MDLKHLASPSQFVQNFSPKYLHKGKGAEVWDVDNNKFIDFVMGCHPLILGYADKDVNKAVKTTRFGFHF